MEEQQADTPVNFTAMLAPVISACFINALYSALLLKQGSGVEITDQVKSETEQEVMNHWMFVWKQLQANQPKAEG